MKILFQCTILFLALGLATSCKNSPKGEAAKTTDAAATLAKAAAAAQNYTIDTQNSSITWTGSKPTGDSHQGTISLSGGNLAIEDGNITAGKFTLDMNSITNTDMPADDGGKKLEGHLKSPDFFDVATHPTAEFAIVSVQKVSGKPGVTHQITGNLSMRGKTKAITFDASVVPLTDRLTAVTPSFTINRTNWDVNFNSGILGTIKDRLISDDIALVINLVATPAG